MDRIDLFRLFVRVVECASFSRAADSLGLQRSTVSTAIQTLEARLGARLLIRTTRRVSPTQDGSLLFEECRRLIADVEEVEAMFRQAGAGPRGMLRVNVPARIGRRILMPALPEFLAAFPDIDIAVGMTDRAVDLAEDRADCVVRVGGLASSNLISRHVGDLDLVNCASPAYLAAHGVPQAPADLSRHLIVAYASPSTGRVEEWEWVEDGQLREQAMRARVIVNSAEAYVTACKAGLGLIQVPAFDVAADIRDGALVEVLPLWRAAPMPLNLLYPHRRHLSRPLTVFSDWLIVLLRREVMRAARV